MGAIDITALLKNVLLDTAKARFETLEISTTFFQSNMLKEIGLAAQFVHEGKVDHSIGALLRLITLANQFEKQIRLYRTTEIKPHFEQGMIRSFDMREIDNKIEAAFLWAEEISKMSSELQAMLRGNRGDLAAAFSELIMKIAQDNRYLDLHCTLNTIVQETEIYRIHHSKDLLSTLFRALKLHPLVAKCSEKLFVEGNYSQAVFEACKALINHVKEKSGQKTLDGEDLMGKVFSIKYNRGTLIVTNKPILQLNALSSLEDIDEQRGFMHLYQGFVIGIRNPKAHATIVQNDPFRAFEYLSLASLLVKRVDEARIST